ncbi:chemotaxis protein CheB [Lujinxingia vulgaris]|uniref:protein-glutamate methylesterase n=1 Tax=Lujinxingia vulgaris TaxID=2600176 RepID=A0A5C6X9Q5_9DELT|nr:CheB methylesterase domain-containing protein [Lujinxingia vulgaris]TXD34012.1 chemotaxis protein CheB [Lujinxingia vulgaris]
MTSPSSTPIRVALLLPEAVQRQNFLELLSDDPLLDVCLELSSTDTLIDRLNRARADLLVIAETPGPGASLRSIIAAVMSHAPMPIVIAATTHHVDQTPGPRAMEGLRAGALTVLPGLISNLDAHQRGQLLLTLHDMSALKVVRRRHSHPPSSPPRSARQRPTPEVIGIAASSGGPAALHQILIELPADFPTPILIVQHFTAGFLSPFIRWLSHDTRLHIDIARDGQPLRPGCVYIAPDHHHLGASQGKILLSNAPAIGGFRPSATHLFTSLADNYGPRAWGIILTGMGRDGVDGLMHMRHRGALTIAQHEQGCAVYGMPRAALESGAAAHALPLSHMPRHLLDRQLSHGLHPPD